MEHDAYAAMEATLRTLPSKYCVTASLKPIVVIDLLLSCCCSHHTHARAHKWTLERFTFVRWVRACVCAWSVTALAWTVGAEIGAKCVSSSVRIIQLAWVSSHPQRRNQSLPPETIATLNSESRVQFERLPPGCSFCVCASACVLACRGSCFSQKRSPTAHQTVHDMADPLANCVRIGVCACVPCLVVCARACG